MWGKNIANIGLRSHLPKMPKIVKVQSMSNNTNGQHSKPPAKVVNEDENSSTTPMPNKNDNTNANQDDSCIYIEDEQMLNKSDIIKSFVAPTSGDDTRGDLSIAVTASGDAIAAKMATNGQENDEGGQVVSDLDESVTSLGSTIDDYNYYNSRLFEDDLNGQVGAAGGQNGTAAGVDDCAGQSSVDEFAAELDDINRSHSYEETTKSK